MATCGKCDIPARLGGDEFAVIAMPRVGDLPKCRVHVFAPLARLGGFLLPPPSGIPQ
jgi:hypothetical protein